MVLVRLRHPPLKNRNELGCFVVETCITDTPLTTIPYMNAAKGECENSGR